MSEVGKLVAGAWRGPVIDFEALRTWAWDGQSVDAINEKRAMFNIWPAKIHEWKDTVPADCRAPVVVPDHNGVYATERELARIVAVDPRGQALLRRADAQSSAPTYAYLVLPLEGARAFITKCRECFAPAELNNDAACRS